jgi:hypothetical protein
MNQAIVDKVIKLLALAKDQNAAPGEVENAKVMAAKLMAKHQINVMDELKASTSRNLFIRLKVETGNPVYIQSDTMLLHACCIFSQVTLITNGNRVPAYTFVGRECDIESMLYMYDILTQQRDSACPPGRKAQREAWLNGFAVGVRQQLEALTARAQAAVVERGLVPLTLDKQALAWYNENVNKTTKGRAKRFDIDGRGVEAGRNAHLNKGVTSTGNETLRLS